MTIEYILKSMWWSFLIAILFIFLIGFFYHLFGFRNKNQREFSAGIVGTIVFVISMIYFLFFNLEIEEKLKVEREKRNFIELQEKFKEKRGKIDSNKIESKFQVLKFQQNDIEVKTRFLTRFKDMFFLNNLLIYYTSNSIIIHELREGEYKFIREIYFGKNHENSIEDIICSNDGNELIVLFKNKLKVFKLTSSSLLEIQEINYPNSPLVYKIRPHKNISLSGNGKSLALGFNREVLLFEDKGNFFEKIQTITYPREVIDVSLSLDGRNLIDRTWDRAFQVYTKKEDSYILLEQPFENKLPIAEISPNLTWVITAKYNTINIYKNTNGKFSYFQEMQVNDIRKIFLGVRCNQNESQIMLIMEKAIIILRFDGTSFKQICSIPIKLSRFDFASVKYNQNWIGVSRNWDNIVISDGINITIWKKEKDSYRELVNLDKVFSNYVAYHPINNVFATSNEEVIKIWRVDTLAN
jgi:hypothetical protein